MFAAYRRFAASPLGMVGAVMCFTTAAILGYRWYVLPITRRKRREVNEDYANYIFEERQKSQENTQ